MTIARGITPFSTDADVASTVSLAATHLAAGGLLAHPTETVYGVGCLLRASSLERLARLKGRSGRQPFVTLIAGASFLDALGVHLDGPAARLAARFWPGPLTLVLATSAVLPEGVLSVDGTVAVRWTSHRGMQRLLEELGEPVTSTSANPHGLPPATTAEEIVAMWPAPFDSGDLLVLDGGAAARGAAPSTIVRCEGTSATVVRAGAIAVADLRAEVPALSGEV